LARKRKPPVRGNIRAGIVRTGIVRTVTGGLRGDHKEGNRADGECYDQPAEAEAR
jgi:hypothetical protein